MASPFLKNAATHLKTLPRKGQSQDSSLNLNVSDDEDDQMLESTRLEKETKERVEAIFKTVGIDIDADMTNPILVYPETHEVTVYIYEPTLSFSKLQALHDHVKADFVISSSLHDGLKLEFKF